MKLKKVWKWIIITILISEILILSGIIVNMIYDEKVLIKPVSVEEFSEEDQSVLLNAMQNYCNINNDSGSKNVVNILSLTDMQYCGIYENPSLNLEDYTSKINAISNLKNMDLAVSIGDLNMSVVNKEISLENLKYITEKFNSFEVETLYTLGNHDRFIAGKTQYDISAEEYYNIALSGLEGTCNFNENDEYSAYYYKDIEDKNMRVCILNCFSEGNYEYIIDNEQLRFIAEEMLDFSDKFNPEDWTVAFFVHTISPVKYHLEQVVGADVLFDILSAYRNGEIYVNRNINVDYSDVKRAAISAIFTGHHHHNYTLQKQGTLVIGMDSIRSTWNRGDRYSEYSDINTNTTFEIISIDTKNRTIYSTKVGNGENRFWSY